MAIKFTCECGKVFNAKDEYEGRRAICPSCRREFVFQAQPTRPSATQEDTPEAASDAESEPPDGNRPFWKDPIVVVGAAVPIAILVGFLSYLAWPTLRAYTRTLSASRIPTTVAVKKVPEPSLDRISPPAKVEAPTEPIVSRPISREELPKWAEGFIALQISFMLDKAPRIQSHKITKLEIRAAPDDPRKIPWLWEATMSIVITGKPSDSGDVPPVTPTMWKTLFQFTPQIDDAGECWREVTDVRSGEKTRVHTRKSEWTRDFRGFVSSKWLSTFMEFEKEAAGASDEEKRMLLQRYKNDLAEQQRISVDELQEILEATD